jgi:hypothetical protein
MSIRISLVTVLLFFLLFVPLGGLFAQFPGGSGNGIVPCDGPDCDICSLAALGQGIINFAVYFSVIVATLLFVYAGFLYITAQGNPAQVSKATGVFKKVLIGMIIVLASWLIVDLIMTTFASKSFGPWNQIVCDGSFSGGSGSNTLGSGNPDDLSGAGSITVPPPAPPPVITGDEYAHATALSSLNSNAINVTSSGGCSDRTVSTCTSLDGVKQTTVSGAVFLKNQCAAALNQTCSMTITGGTETGHATGEFSHENGYKVDVSASNVQLSRFILGNATQANGNTFVLTDSQTGESYEYQVINETDHLDVRVIQKSAPAVPDPTAGQGMF